MSELIHSVTRVEIDLLQSNPVIVRLSAHGQVSSTGWSNPVLIPNEKIPADGFYEFDFCASPPDPGTIVNPVFTDVSAHLDYEEGNLPPGFSGIVVKAKTNSIKVSK